MVLYLHTHTHTPTHTHHTYTLCKRDIVHLPTLIPIIVLRYIIFARMGEVRGCIGSWWGNRRERDRWGDLGVDGWIILGWISRRWDVGIWTGLGWSRIETGGGRL